MNIPDKVKICGMIYDCIQQEHMCRDDGALGMSCANALQIKIDKDIPAQQKESTLIHEIIEQINFLYQLELEHPKIKTLEAALYQVIKDNPDIFKEGTK